MANLPPAYSGLPQALTPAHPQAIMPPVPVLKPTWEGFVSSTGDALILFEAVLSGALERTVRRPHDRERAQLIKSGSIFIYEENGSGIKRWTDGLPWSPSRILGNYLIYRELDKPFPPGEKKRATKKSKRNSAAEPYPTSRHPSLAEPMTESPIESPYTPLQPSMSNTMSPLSVDPRRSSGGEGIDGTLHKHLVGSLTDSYQFKERGLIKKTMSIKFSETVVYHLVSYYKMEDCVGDTLLRVPTDPKIRAMELDVRPALYTSQNWRAPIDEGQRIEEGLFPGNIASTYHASVQNWAIPLLNQVISNPPLPPPMPIKQEVYALPSMQPPYMQLKPEPAQSSYGAGPPAGTTAMALPIHQSSMVHPAVKQEAGNQYPGYPQSGAYQPSTRSTGSNQSASYRSEHNFTVDHRASGGQAVAGSSAALMTPSTRSPYDGVSRSSIVSSGSFNYTHTVNNSPTNVVSPHSGFDPNRTSYSQQVPAYAPGFSQLPPMDQQQLQQLSHHSQQHQYQQPQHVARQQYDPMAQFPPPFSQMLPQTQQPQQMQPQTMPSMQPLPNLDTSYSMHTMGGNLTPQQQQQQQFFAQTGWSQQ